MMKRAFILFLLFGMFLGNAISLSAQEQKAKPQWEKHLEFSHVITTGNTDTATMAAKLDIAKEGDKKRFFLKGDALYGEDNDEETKNKWSIDTRLERIFTKRLFGFLSANYIDDKFSGYEYRAAVGPGLGYDLVKTENHKLKSLISSLYYYDKFSDGIENKDSYLSGKAEMDYKWQILENLRFDQVVKYLVSFEDNKNEDNKKYFIDSETALKLKVNKNISLGVSYTVAYQNLLPPLAKKHTDTTYLTSLIVDF